MAASPQQRHIEALLAEAGWVRSIARRLVRDSHDAEDVAQDTLVAALEANDELGSGRHTDLRSWLGAVGRNLSLRRVRREAQRRDVECTAARDEATGGVEGVAERVEFQRRLAEAILALEEPYRSAVVLRYLDGLAPEVIAERLEITNANARQRVSRGIAMLRARLDRELGARALWALPLARLAEQGAGTGAVVTGAGVGGILMGTKVVLGGLIAAVALTTAWVVNRVAEVEGKDIAVTTPHEVSAPETHSPGSGPGALDTPAPSPGERRAASAEPLGARASELVSVGRATDIAGRPLAGLSVAPYEADGWRVEGWPEEGGSNATDQRGFFELTSRNGALPTHVRLESSVYLPSIFAVPETSPWEVVLQARPVIEGRVTDPTGAPVSPPGTVTAIVQRGPRDGLIELHVQTQSDGTFRASGGTAFMADIQSDGTYRISGLPVGQLTVASTRAQGFPLQYQRVERELTAGSHHVLDLVLEPGLVVRGVVLDEDSRRPVPFAKVWGDVYEFAGTPDAPSTTADAEGRFRLEGFKKHSPVTIGGEEHNIFLMAAAAPEGESSPLSLITQAPDERGEYVVELLLSSQLCALTGQVFEHDGTTPAAGVQFWAVDAKDQSISRTTDEIGRFDIEGLAKGHLGYIAYRRERGASGFFESRLGELGLNHRAVNELQIVLQADSATEIAGRIVDTQDQPAFGVEVRAQYYLSSGGLAYGMFVETATTDADGYYRFTGMHAGHYKLRTPGCLSPTSHDLQLTSGQCSTANFVSHTCMTVDGWVELNGTPADDLQLQVFTPDRQWRTIAEVAKDGTFQIPDVIASDLELVLYRNGERLDQAPVTAADPTGIVLRVP